MYALAIDSTFEVHWEEEEEEKTEGKDTKMKSSFINLESKRNNTTKCEQIIIDLSFVDNRQMKDKEV